MRVLSELRRKRARPRRRTTGLLTGLFALGLAVGRALGANPAPLEVPAQHGVVASDTPDASRAGAEVLERGGNAIDAAIATALALGVVSPAGSGLGGGGFAVVWNAKTGRATVLDFREVAPKAASRDMFADEPKGAPSKSVIGGLAVAVPAEPAGLAALHEKLGRLPLTDVVAPAAKLARLGFWPTARLVDTATRIAPTLAADEPLAAWLKAALTSKSRVVRPALADTLTRFGKQGRAGFYTGPVAADLVATVRAHGGVLTLEDLRDYQPIWREPLRGTFRSHDVWAAPPPAGGATALEALHFLDALPALPKGSLGSSAWFHRIAEALTHAFADRARWMGDPAFFDVPTEKLVSPAYGKALAGRYREDGVLPLEDYGTAPPKGSPVEPPHDHGTSHVCVIDKEGNAVAITTTVNLELGARIEGKRSGVLLNDQMDDFAARPGRANGFGLVGAEANAIAPGKRPTSSMTPMLVMDGGRVLMCVGASGGPTIVASSVQAIAAVLDEGVDAQTAVSMPRIYAQWRPEGITVEQDVPTDVVEGLKRRKHAVRSLPPVFRPAAQIILRKGDGLEAASDPRKGGVPAAQR